MGTIPRHAIGRRGRRRTSHRGVGGRRRSPSHRRVEPRVPRGGVRRRRAPRRPSASASAGATRSGATAGPGPARSSGSSPAGRSAGGPSRRRCTTTARSGRSRVEPEDAGGSRITQRYEVVKLGPLMDRFIYQFVPVHRDRREALTADLRRIGDVARGPEAATDRVGCPSEPSRGITMARLRSAPVAVLTMLTLATAPALLRFTGGRGGEEARDHHGARHQRRRRGGARDRRAGRGAAQGQEHQGRGGRAGGQPERHRRKHHAGHPRHATGDDRERLQGHRGAGLSRRHDHRRARPAGREAERGDVGDQQRPEPGHVSPTCRARSAPPGWR